MAASPDLTNLGAASMTLPVRRSIFSTNSENLQAMSAKRVSFLRDKLKYESRLTGSVTVENGGVTGTDLTRVVKDDNLGVERSSLHRGVVLGVTTDVTSSDVLDGNVLDVETNVVSGETLGDLLVVHLNGLDFSGNVGGSELDDHT